MRIAQHLSLALPSVILIAICAIRVHAAPTPESGIPVPGYEFRSLRADESIWQVTQDRDGFIWLATTRGLLRHDGVEFDQPERLQGYGAPTRKLTTARGDHWLTPLHARWEFGDDGVIQERKPGKGPLVHIRGDEITRYQPGQDFPGTTINILQEDERGQIWLGTSEGLFVLQGKRFVGVGGTSGLPRAGMMDLHISNAGMAVATTRGLFTSTSSDLAASFARLGPATSASAVVREPSGTLWVGTGIGLFRFDAAGEQRFTTENGLPDNRVRALATSPDGSLWIGLQAGLVHHQGGHFTSHTLARSGIADDLITDLLVDRDWNLWAASRAGGVIFGRKVASTHVTPRDGLLAGESRSVVVDVGGNIWASVAGGVSRIAGLEVSPLRTGQELPGGEIVAMTPSPLAGVWLAIAGSGLVHHDGTRARSWQYAQGVPKDIRILASRSDGTLWAASGDGTISQLQITGDVVTVSQSFSAAMQASCGSQVRALADDGQGNLWIATEAGLGRHSRAKQHCYGPGDGLKASGVDALLPDTDGSIWFTAGGSLHRFQGDRLQVFGAGEGPRCSGAKGILDDRRGSLWLACASGVQRLPRRLLEQGPTLLEHFGADIIQTPRLSVGPGTHLALSPDRRLWVATERGITVFHDADHPLGRETLTPVIHQIQVDGRSLLPAVGSLDVAAPRTIRIAWTAPSFAAPERLLFSHRLLGMETTWRRNQPQRFVEYEDLPPGRYTFEVVVSSDPQGPQRNLATLSVAVGPPWMLQPRFLLAALAALGLLLALVFRFRWQQSRRMHSAIEDERGRIARDLHDGLGQDFMALSFHVDALEKRIPDDTVTRGLLQRTRQLVERAREDARSAVWKIQDQGRSGIPVRGLIDDVVQSFRATGQGERLTVRLDGVSGDIDPVAGHELGSIARESLTNAIRYGGEGPIDLFCDLHDDQIRLSIRDHGAGFDPETIDPNNGQHFGLMGMKERARKVGGSLTIQSEPGRGTSVTVQVPMRRRSA